MTNGAACAAGTDFQRAGADCGRADVGVIASEGEAA